MAKTRQSMARTVLHPLLRQAMGECHRRTQSPWRQIPLAAVRHPAHLHHYPDRRSWIKKQTSNTSSEGKITRIPKRTWCGDSVNWATCASVVVSSCSFTKAKFLEPVAETYQRDHSFTNGILVRDLIASDNSGWLMKNPKEPLLCLWTSNKENF